jgi:hypothetical protein
VTERRKPQHSSPPLGCILKEARDKPVIVVWAGGGGVNSLHGECVPKLWQSCVISDTFLTFKKRQYVKFLSQLYVISLLV